MLETLLSLVDAERTIHVQVHDGLTDVAMAAVTAEPATIEQWRTATERFIDVSVADFMMEHCQAGLAKTKVEGGHLIVDMTAKLLVVGTTLPDVPRLGNVQACDEHTTLDVWLPYRIPDDWEILDSERNWESRARRRGEQLQGTWQVDQRNVLYTQAAAWLVEAWLQKASHLKEPARQLQESWLLSPRDDLQGQSPRQVLLAKRKFIDGDIQDQGQNWSITGRCPPGLSPRSHAYRFGGFGTHEIVLYHEMTSYLLFECERRMRSRTDVDVVQEVRHLEQLQQDWLHQPQQALYDQTPAALIARERARLPAVVPERHADDHDDCPLCRMMRDSGEPMFWQLDNIELDDCFATSLYDTLDEWEEAQEAWKGTCFECEQEGGVAPSGSDENEASVWQRSHTNMQHVDDMPPLEACGVMMFSIGGHMAELIQDLRPCKASTDVCRNLHERFDDLRVSVKDHEDVWVIQTNANSFGEVLKDVVRLRQELAAKCEDLEDKLDFFCRRYQEHFDEDLEAAL